MSTSLSFNLLILMTWSLFRKYSVSTRSAWPVNTTQKSTSSSKLQDFVNAFTIRLLEMACQNAGPCVICYWNCGLICHWSTHLSHIGYSISNIGNRASNIRTEDFSPRQETSHNSDHVVWWRHSEIRWPVKIELFHFITRQQDTYNKWTNNNM